MPSSLKWFAPWMFALAAAAPPETSAAEGEPVTDEASFVCTGHFRFAGGHAERAARHRAIDEVVDDLNVFVRPIAKARLERSTAIAERLSISRVGTRTTVSFDGRVYATDQDGVGVEVIANTGERVTLTHRWDGRDLLQSFRGEDGGRLNRFQCSPGRLKLDSRISSTRLPREIHFTLTYAGLR